MTKVGNQEMWQIRGTLDIQADVFNCERRKCT